MEPIGLGHLAVWHHSPTTGPAKARVLLVHGLGEHSARHTNTINFLLGHDIDVVRFDLRGSGKSGGRRQWVEKFEHYVEDVAQVFNWTQRELAPLPLFVLGHSLGGAVATYFTSLYQNSLTGVILSAPAYIVGGAISPVKIKVGKLLSRLAPTLRIPGNTDLDCLSRDPAVGKAYGEDPLSCHYNTVQQGKVILDALDSMVERCQQITVPVLIAHGSSDRLVRLEGSFELLRALKSQDRSMYIIPGGYHEPHNDLDKEEYFLTVNRWILKHLPAQSS